MFLPVKMNQNVSDRRHFLSFNLTPCLIVSHRPAQTIKTLVTQWNSCWSELMQESSEFLFFWRFLPWHCLNVLTHHFLCIWWFYFWEPAAVCFFLFWYFTFKFLWTSSSGTLKVFRNICQNHRDSVWIKYLKMIHDSVFRLKLLNCEQGDVNGCVFMLHLWCVMFAGCPSVRPIIVNTTSQENLREFLQIGHKHPL